MKSRTVRYDIEYGETWIVLCEPYYAFSSLYYAKLPRSNSWTGNRRF